jgi:filamentous hemagglutinin
VNTLAHAILGGAVAALQGNSAAAGAAGAAAGELAARAITGMLYPDVKDLATLSEEQKQTISMLSTISAGLAGGLAGDSTTSTAAGAQAGKTAVENNALANKYGIDKLDKDGLALYEKLKSAGIGNIDDLQEQFVTCGGNGDCERNVRNEYRKREKEAGEKLVELYKSGQFTQDEFNLFVTDYANAMLAGVQQGQLSSEWGGLLGDIYTQSGISWTPAGVVGSPYFAAIRGSEQIAEWKSQGLSDEKISELALKDSVISSALSPVDISGIMNLLDNGASSDEVMTFAAGAAFSKAIKNTQTNN